MTYTRVTLISNKKVFALTVTVFYRRYFRIKNQFCNKTRKIYLKTMKTQQREFTVVFDTSQGSG